MGQDSSLMTCFFAIAWLYLWISFWYLVYILALFPQTEFLFGRWYLSYSKQYGMGHLPTVPQNSTTQYYNG
jgi:hypothetical protein